MPDTQRPMAVTLQVVSIVLFTFIGYLNIGIPLAVLPGYVHSTLGYGAVIAGLVISVQYLATLLSRPYAGKIIDNLGSKRAVVIGRSNIVGLPVSKLLLDANATVTMAHSRTRNLGEVTRRADILVVAIGRPKFVTADMVRDGAVVIDVGVNRDPETGKLCGDVDFAAIEPKASVITPVPGGVGPMTICCLMENTIECFLRRMGRK